jgi:hypothetical protein
VYCGADETAGLTNASSGGDLCCDRRLAETNGFFRRV